MPDTVRMSVFEFRDYKGFIARWLEQQPNRGRGLLARMSEHLRLSQGMLSHIFNGDKHLSLEAGYDLALFLGLNEEESEYFLLLIQWARAGSHALGEKLRKKVAAEQQKSMQLANKMKPDHELAESAKTTFYSNWLYSGIRNMTACEQFSTVDQIADHLRVSRASAQKVIDFLVQQGLCVLKKGKLSVGPQVTHIGSQRDLVCKHHQNWRLQGLNQMLEFDEQNVFFTSPMSLSRETAEAIRMRIPSFIEEVRKAVGPSPSEVVYCLNIDWFRY